jgi:hypothetical protein
MKLCYVKGNEAYFHDKDPKEVWGDDWNDVPYEHNAGPPYDYKLKVYFECGYAEQPCDGYGNSPYSVEDINKSNIPWLKANGVCIYPGDTFDEFKAKIKQLGGEVYLPLSRIAEEVK